jgi:N-acetyl-alpha-D-muramate 1-phosphate uridylyltransferase
MPRRLCAVLLAAGEGRRLRPMTELRPKPLCPIANTTLIDRAFVAVNSLGFAGPDDVAVNAWHLAGAIVDAVGDRAHVGVETGPAPLGSSGGLAGLRDWIDGRDVIVANADAYLYGGSVAGLTRDWTGDEVRMLVVPAGRHVREFGEDRFAGFSVIPWHYIEGLKAEPSDLVFTVWRPAEKADELRTVRYGGDFIDCGTPLDYLTANLNAAAALGGTLISPTAEVTGTATRSVVGAGARVAGHIVDSMVWPDAYVDDGEILHNVIRYGPTRADTVYVPLR